MRNLSKIQHIFFGSLVILFLTVIGVTLGKVYAQEHSSNQNHSSPPLASENTSRVSGQGVIAISVAITMGIACLSAGYAVAKVGAAALGAVAEKPELMGKALLFVGLAEGIAIYGLIIALFLIRQL